MMFLSLPLELASCMGWCMGLICHALSPEFGLLTEFVSKTIDRSVRQSVFLLVSAVDIRSRMAEVMMLAGKVYPDESAAGS